MAPSLSRVQYGRSCTQHSSQRAAPRVLYLFLALTSTPDAMYAAAARFSTILRAQNRQGLGQKDRPKKVAGARWAGKKVTFGGDKGAGSDGGSDDSDGGEEGGAGAGAGARAKKAAAPAPSGSKGLERSGSERTGGESAGAASGLKSPDKVKWKARRALSPSDPAQGTPFAAPWRSSVARAFTETTLSQTRHAVFPLSLRRSSQSQRCPTPGAP